MNHGLSWGAKAGNAIQMFYYFDQIKEFVNANFNKKSKRFQNIYEKIIAKNFEELRLDLGVIAILWFGLVNPLWAEIIELNYN